MGNISCAITHEPVFLTDHKMIQYHMPADSSETKAQGNPFRGILSPTSTAFYLIS